MAFIPIYILILFLTIVIDYIAGIEIDKCSGRKRKNILIISIISNVGVLFIFKYYNFFISNIDSVTNANFPLLNIILPIGLSFHTFQAMSYTIEVYRGNQKPEKHFGIYALYVMFYPQLVAGPIERPQNILHQFREEKQFDYANFVDGLKLIAWGMFKKVVVADRIAIYVNSVFNNHDQYEGLPVIIACCLFSFQIYLDFSGYSDIAIGTAKTMGFHLMTNFNRPYQAKTIVEFWSRWHISLSTWFRDYLYIPLGGNRISKTRTALNQLIVFTVSGFWHGANWTFMIWGFIHSCFVITSTRLTRIFKTGHLPKLVKQFFVFIIVSFAWVFFRAESLKQALEIIASSYRNISDQLASLMRNRGMYISKLVYANNESSVFIYSAVFLLFVIFIEWRQKHKTIPQYFNSLPMLSRNLLYLFLVYGCIFLSAGGSSQFIYFQF